MTVDYSVQRVENPDSKHTNLTIVIPTHTSLDKLIDDSVALFLELMSNGKHGTLAFFPWLTEVYSHRHVNEGHGRRRHKPLT